jgi:hypothetical protein
MWICAFAYKSNFRQITFGDSHCYAKETKIFHGKLSFCQITKNVIKQQIDEPSQNGARVMTSWNNFKSWKDFIDNWAPVVAANKRLDEVEALADGPA